MSQSALRNKRGSQPNINRSSEMIDMALRHVGTKQKLFMEVHICSIFQSKIDHNEPFSETHGNILVDKQFKKRIAHCTGRLLEDRISMERVKSSGKLPFRPWTFYKEISHIFIAQNHKECLIMCVISTTSNNKYYELYACKSADDAVRVHDYVNRALADQDFVLRGVNSKRLVHVTDEDVRKSVVDLGTLSMQDDEEIEIAEIQPLQKSEPSIYHYSPKTDTSVDRRSQSLRDLRDITYISFHHHSGLIVSDNGPVYMYCTRVKHTIDGDVYDGMMDENNYYG